ncbi:uncharacterized protein LOC130807996 [Amaranthus tricolor]|uniref:uncharacterized protein LOC130807996 n=1 Tax=Amaranthus tricolor TaxID=29722 RepID=UPI0025909B84|nr:uncharacterized protein LOC130807996 [Amaranthus tricolor]
MYQQQQKLTNMHQTASLLYKNLIQFVISLCVFCFIVLHPSWLPFIHSFISHLCTFSSHLFSLATDKKYIFLLCNGILVLIAKYPSQRIDTRLPLLPETSPDEDLSFGKYQQDVATNKEVMMEEDKVVDEKYVVYQITNGEEQEEEDVTNDGDDEKYEQEEVEDEKYEQEEVEDEKYEQKKEKDGYGEYEEEEEEEEETISKMSTEELNRKFDDFIRKMKEELRIEAQRQLILV